MPYAIAATRSGYVAETTTQPSLDEVETWIATYANRTVADVTPAAIQWAIDHLDIVGHARVYRLPDHDVEFIVTMDWLPLSTMDRRKATGTWDALSDAAHTLTTER